MAMCFEMCDSGSPTSPLPTFRPASLLYLASHIEDLFQHRKPGLLGQSSVALPSEKVLRLTPHGEDRLSMP
jgi:hypothetical protein